MLTLSDNTASLWLQHLSGTGVVIPVACRARVRLDPRQFAGTGGRAASMGGADDPAGNG
jgi:hypothetical protein